MISRLQSEYTGRVAEIWLEGNLNALNKRPLFYSGSILEG